VESLKNSIELTPGFSCVRLFVLVECLGKYEGHRRSYHSICNVEHGLEFLTA